MVNLPNWTKRRVVAFQSKSTSEKGFEPDVESCPNQSASPPLNMTSSQVAGERRRPRKNNKVQTRESRPGVRHLASSSCFFTRPCCCCATLLTSASRFRLAALKANKCLFTNRLSCFSFTLPPRFSYRLSSALKTDRIRSLSNVHCGIISVCEE